MSAPKVECDGSSTCPAGQHVDDCSGEALAARWCDEHGQPWLLCTECPASGEFPEVSR